MLQELTKQSTHADIESYFNGVLQVSASGEEFPVNLDQVWPLAYARKYEAIRYLKDNFIQNVDYQVFRRNAKNLQGGRPEEFYMLSVPCLEFLVARKHQEIFEVYRRVFHIVMGMHDKTKAMHMAMDFIEKSKSALNMDNYCTARMINKVADNMGLVKIDYIGSTAMRLCATELLKATGSTMKVREFNKLAVEMGLLEIKEHHHRDGSVEKYKSITPDAFKYGGNYRAVQSTGVTQPLWNEETFPELLQIVLAYKENKEN